MPEKESILDFSSAITCIYGKPATGKTTICLTAAAAEKGKVVFIDTENGFYADRLMQIAGKLPENITVVKARDFMEQCRAVDELLNLKGKIKLVIVDSFTAHYRKELQEKHDINPLMSRQLSILSEIARENIPVIVTSQVYTTQENKVQPVGSNMLKNWCGNVIKLENEGRRKLIVEKHRAGQLKEIEFEIVNEGIQTKTR
ncbi:MAG TPA: AAA family ATPase [Nanoarchaeota archaeon]|nr:AAA family ATPase [Nanoarchaeota archaeon]